MVLVWQNGKLKPEVKSRNSWRNSLLRFDDNTKTLWTGIMPNGPFSPTKMVIVQQGPDDDWDLVALSTIIVNGHFIGNEALRIRSWDKKAGLVFLFTTSDAALSGKCIVIPTI